MPRSDYRDFIITPLNGAGAFCYRLTTEEAGITIGQSFMVAMRDIINEGRELQGSWEGYTQPVLVCFPSGVSSIQLA